MLTIEVPDELAAPLSEQAARRGVTPEALALDHLRALVSSPPPGSLLEFLSDRVGAVAGTGEPYPRDGDRRFADGLAVGRTAGP